jgi:6-phospho-3-hexuloisomerase
MRYPRFNDVSVRTSPPTGCEAGLDENDRKQEHAKDLGRSVSVVGDMTTPAIGKGDLLIVTAGPGMLSTVHALVSVAKSAGALVLTITAEPEGQVSKMSDEILVLPAQTMANDHGENVSILPMGSVYEGALFVLFEVIVLKLKAAFKVTDQIMRSNHTNLE